MDSVESVETPKSHDLLMLCAILSLIGLLCLSLWFLRNFYWVGDLTAVEMQDGVFDLQELELEHGLVRLTGNVEYLPGILMPEEFDARCDEALVGNPWRLHAVTSRLIVKVPDGVYTLSAPSADYAYRVYINGELRHQTGVPTETAEDFIPSYAQMTLDVRPVNGEIEIVQQSANFVHRKGSNHSNLYFGEAPAVHRYLALTLGTEAITVGLFAALFVIHLMLFVIRRSYRPNLIFSLLCLTWMVRTGVANAKIFYALFPHLSWQVAFRLEYLSLPIACFLLLLLAKQVFPDLLPTWFLRLVGAVSAGFAAFCLVGNTVLMSQVLLYYEGFFSLSSVFFCVCFAKKVPDMIRSKTFRPEQAVSMVGYIFFMTSAVNDALHHSGAFYLLGFTSSFAMTGLAMMVFSFFVMTTMFYGTMQEAALAHERERRTEAENEILSEMNRLKSAFYTDMPHEMKTPLTVIAINSQFAAQNISAGLVDDETVTDLNAITTEAKRLAQMVTSLVGIGRLQGAEGTVLAIDALLNETASIYQGLFARKNNTLTVETAPNLLPVAGNADQLLQVLINLLSNANRHTTGGHVLLQATVSPQGDMVTVTVSDDGEGIAPELLPRVFERFTHGDNGGSGLGLAICKTIVEEHGGEIGVNSEVGQGTAVWFTLPVSDSKKGGVHDE